MLKLIVGKKGSGKTKQLIEQVNNAVATSNGKVVCIEKGSKLTYDVNHDVRLLNTEDFGVSGYDSFYGFLAGIAASDYDVKEIFIDSLAKIVGDDEAKISEFLGKVETLAEGDGLTITMTVSRGTNELPQNVEKYVALSLA